MIRHRQPHPTECHHHHCQHEGGLPQGGAPQGHLGGAGEVQEPRWHRVWSLWPGILTPHDNMITRNTLLCKEYQ